ncbi:hypothetical protein BGZ57DRAFT_768309, partial [Hyaloscypha finlandica]
HRYPYAGFTGEKDGAWMRTHDDYKEINVASQIKDPKSVLYFWKNMITVRKEYKGLFVHGEFEEFQMQDESIFIFGKKHGRARTIVALNFTSEEQTWNKP